MIAGFSFVGIVLGVATLIIVMAVMNGFRNQLFEKILGLNGHLVVYKIASAGPFNEYDELATKIRTIPGIKTAVPLIEGQVLVSSSIAGLGGLVRGMDEEGMRSLPLVANNILQGTIDGFDAQDGIAVGNRLAVRPRGQVGRQHHLDLAAWIADPVRHLATLQSLPHLSTVRDGHVRIRPDDDVHAARRGQEIL